MLFPFLRPKEIIKPTHHTYGGAPLLTCQTDLSINDVPPPRLIKFIDRDFVTLARNGEDFDGIVHSVSWDKFCSIEYNGSPGFPVLNPLIDLQGKFCHLVSADEGRMIKMVRRKNSALISYFIEEVIPQKNLIFFRLPVRFRFESDKFVYESKKGGL
jgi:hypothetical protein